MVHQRSSLKPTQQGYLNETLFSCTHFAYVFQIVNFRRESTVHAEELLVHEGRQRQTVERVHASVVHPLRVFYFTCKQRNNASTTYQRFTHSFRNNELDTRSIVSTCFFSLSLSLSLSFLQTRSPVLFVGRFLSSASNGTEQRGRRREEKERGGWMGKVCLFKLTGCRLEYYYEWNL